MEYQLTLEISTGNVDGVKRWIDAGADVNNLNMWGKAPLHYAAENENDKVCDLLLHTGADQNVTDEEGQTPLHYAAKNENDKVCYLLLRAGADPNVKGREGQTPLHYAAKKENDKVCDLLLRAGADQNAEDKEGVTPLHFAAGNENGKVCDMLLRAGADQNVKDKLGDLPLHKAAVNTNEQVCDMLLKANVDLNVSNYSGYTPLHKACLNYNSWNRLRVIEVLLRAGADSNIRNTHNDTPFYYLKDKVQLAHAKEFDQNVSLCKTLMAEGSQPIDVIKVYMCGDAAAGKTTLKNSLTSKPSFMRKLGIRSSKKEKQQENYDRTPGIDVAKQAVENESYIFWDCAGQIEYSLTHGMFLGVGDSLFIVVYDLEKFSKGSMATTEYWLPFIKSLKSSSEKPRVVMVGTHFDAIHEKNAAGSAAKRLLAQAKMMFAGSLDIDDTVILVDSREDDSEGLAVLKGVMKKHRSEIMGKVQVPRLCNKLLKKVIRPLRNEAPIPVIGWKSYEKSVRKSYPGMGGDMLQATTKYLHLMGEVYIAEFNDETENQLILSTNWFTRNIIGAAFAGQEFARQFNILQNKKFYTLEELHSFFIEMEDTAQLLNVLDDMDLVHTSDTGNYLIPGKLPDDIPDVTWSTEDALEVKGIGIECVANIDIFNPNVFPSIQKKILDVCRESYSISKFAVAFSKGAIGMLVQQTEHKRSIYFAAQCPDVSHVGACYSSLQEINELVSSEIVERSPGTNTRQTYISQASLRGNQNLQGVTTYTRSQLFEAEEEQSGFVTSACKSERVTKIVCAGYDTMFLDEFGPNCHYKWLPVEIKKQSVGRLDVKHDLWGEDYIAVGRILGMEDDVVKNIAESTNRKEESVTQNIVQEWCLTHKRRMTLAMFQQVLYYLSLVDKQGALKAIDDLLKGLMQQKYTATTEESKIEFRISKQLVQWRVVLKRLWRYLKAEMDPNMLTSRLLYIPLDICKVIEAAKEGDVKTRVENADILLHFLLQREQDDWPDDLLMALKETDQNPIAEVLQDELAKVAHKDELREEIFLQQRRLERHEFDDHCLHIPKPTAITEESKTEIGISKHLLQWRIVLKRLWRDLKADMDPKMLTSRLMYIPRDICVVIEATKEGDVEERIKNAEALLQFLLRREQDDWPDDLLKALNETDQKPLAEFLEKEYTKVVREDEQSESDDQGLHVQGATCADWDK